MSEGNCTCALDREEHTAAKRPPAVTITASSRIRDKTPTSPSLSSASRDWAPFFHSFSLRSLLSFSTSSALRTAANDRVLLPAFCYLSLQLLHQLQQPGVSLSEVVVLQGYRVGSPPSASAAGSLASRWSGFRG